MCMHACMHTQAAVCMPQEHTHTHTHTHMESMSALGVQLQGLGRRLAFWFRVQVRGSALGCRVQVRGAASCPGRIVQGLGFRVQDLGLSSRISALGSMWKGWVQGDIHDVTGNIVVKVEEEEEEEPPKDFSRHARVRTQYVHLYVGFWQTYSSIG